MGPRGLAWTNLAALLEPAEFCKDDMLNQCIQKTMLLTRSLRLQRARMSEVVLNNFKKNTRRAWTSVVPTYLVRTVPGTQQVLSRGLI